MTFTDMKVLFFGGCLLTTKTVARDKRFVNVLQAGNPELEIELARYASFSLVKEIFEAQFKVHAPDVIVFLIRPFPFYILSKLFPRVPGLKGGNEFKMHPGLLNKQEWFTENDRLIVEMDWNPNGTKRTITHSINLKLGKILGLEKWAIRHVKNTLLELSEACRKRSIRLIVVSPPAVQNDPVERALLVNLNLDIIKSFENYIDLFSGDFSDNMLGPDKVHYNDAGHSLLAKKIEEKLFTLHASAAAR